MLRHSMYVQECMYVQENSGFISHLEHSHEPRTRLLVESRQQTSGCLLLLLLTFIYLSVGSLGSIRAVGLTSSLLYSLALTVGKKFFINRTGVSTTLLSWSDKGPIL